MLREKNNKKCLAWAQGLTCGYALVLAVLLFVVVIYTIRDIAGGNFELSVHKLPPRHLDFVRFYALGQMILSPDRFMLYDPATQLAWLNKFIAPAVMTNVFYMEYPPFAFLIMSILAAVTLVQAYSLWMLFSCAFASIAMAFLLKKIRQWSNKDIFWFLLALNASYIAWNSYFAGQLGMIFLAVVSIFCFSFLKKNDTVSGVMLAISTVKLQYLPFLLVPALAMKRGKLLLVFLVVELLFLVISAVCLGWQNVVYYPAFLYRSESQPWPGTETSMSQTCLRGLLTCLCPKSMAALLSTSVLFVVLAGLYFVWKFEFKSGQKNLPFLFALTMLSIVCFSPHSHLYDCSVLALAAALTLPGVSFAKALAAKSQAMKWWSLLLILYPLTSWFLLIGNNNVNGKPYYFCYLFLNLLLLSLGIVAYKQKIKSSTI